MHTPLSEGSGMISREVAMHQLAVKAAESPKPKPKPPHHLGLHGHQRRHRGYELIAYAFAATLPGMKGL